MNCLVVFDDNWDSLPIVIKRIESLKKIINLVNVFYGKQLQLMEKACNKNYIQLMRRPLSKKNIKTDIFNVLNKMNFAIVFHNFIEYNNISSYVIKLCKGNNKNVFIFSENTTDFLLNDTPYICKFKTVIKQEENFMETINNCNDVEYELNNETHKNKPALEHVITNMNKNYEELQTSRQERSLKILYDKDKCKTDKLAKKQHNQLKYIDMMEKRSKWKKGIIPKS